MDTSMIAFVNLIAGISWEPEIRGALVVLVGSVVLFGSVWLILTTNLGSRLGTLNSLAGFFGWMFIMGVVWWMYGIGLTGDAPTWQIDRESFVYGDDGIEGFGGDVSDLSGISITPANELVEIYCPGLVDATVSLQRDRFVTENPNLELTYDGPDHRFCIEPLGELLAVDEATIADEARAANDDLIDDAERRGVDDPRIQTEAELEASIAQEIRDEGVKLNQLTLSGLKAVAPDLIELAENDGLLDFNGWRLLSTGEAGEAIASADAGLVDSANETPFSGGDFLTQNVFERGGKDSKGADDGQLERFWLEIKNTVKFWHPEKTVVVQVAPTIEKEQVEGQAPPFPEVDPAGEVASVVMVRDLGNLRLPPALVTIGSLIAFLLLCWQMHLRDKKYAENVAAWDPSAEA